jgi:hypothetical protein
MAEQFKRHYVALDMYKESSSEFEVVEGDTANLIIITLTDRGTPVDLTDCKVVIAFVRAGVPVEQDSDGHGVTISGENHNIITVDLYATSYAYGRNTAEVQVWSGEAFNRLATSAWFNFKSRRARINEATLLAVPQWPIISGMINVFNNIVRGIQSKWSTTNVNDPSYIQDKPVIGTDIQAPTNSLPVDYSPVGTDAAPFFRLGTGHIKMTLATILGYIRAQLDSYFSPLSHASRHASGGADEVTPTAIKAVSYGGAQALADSDKTQARANVNAAKAVDGLADAMEARVPYDDFSDSITISAANVGRNARINSASNKTATFPQLTAGYYGFITRVGTGTLTMVAGSGVTFQSAGGRLKISEQYKKIYFNYLSSSVVELQGSFIA